MKINAVNAQTFRSFYQNQKVDYSKEQEEIVMDIYKKSITLNPNQEKATSLLGNIKADYNMDLFADPSSDKKSINLYISENVPDPNGNPYKINTRLTFIGNYSSKHAFDTKDVKAKIDEITGKSTTNIVNSLATIIAVLTLISTPIIGVAMLVKDKSAQKVEQVIKHTTDSLKELPKDTLNLAKKVIK